MPRIKDIYANLDKLAPFSTAMEWDNTGLLVGSMEWEAAGCILSLDVTNEAIRLAKETKSNLIVTHHPVIFSPLHCLLEDNIVYRLAQEKIAVLSAHTNLDLVEGGVNDALCHALELRNVQPFLNGDHLGRIAELSNKMTVSEFAAYAKERLSAPEVSFTAGETPIFRIAVVSGSGGDYLGDAMRQGADALLTGEVRHHQIVTAVNAGFPLVSAGHYSTEAVILPVLNERFGRAFPEMPCQICRSFDCQAI